MRSVQPMMKVHNATSGKTKLEVDKLFQQELIQLC